MCSVRSPVLGPVTMTLAPGQLLQRAVRQQVPAGAPAGEYVYTGLVGDFPNAPIDSDSFMGAKLAERGTGVPVATWQVTDAATGAPVEAGARWGGEAALSASVVAPSAFALSAAYPNPFRGQTTLTLDVPTATRLRVAVYDVLGREVAVLLDGAVEAGPHTAVLDATAVPSGRYLVRATAGDAVSTPSVTLMR